MLYPNASDGAHILQIAAITMIFVAMNHTLQGSLFGLGKMYVPALALLTGSVVKICLNLILIRNPNINIYGAMISSFVCQIITFTIIYATLKKSIDFKIDVKNGILKPLLSGIIMSLVIIVTYMLLNKILGNSLTTIICILLGAVSYLISILLLKTLSKNDICSLPKGEKIYNLLVKLKFYK